MVGPEIGGSIDRTSRWLGYRCAGRKELSITPSNGHT